MESSKLIQISNDGINFKFNKDELIFRIDKVFYRTNNLNNPKLVSNAIFKKSGKARDFIVVDKFIYCRDFVDLYKISIDNLEILQKWHLGNDLSSDICDLAADENYIYCTIRNGQICTINRQTDLVDYHKVSDFSLWDMVLSDADIYAGTVNGELLIIEKSTFSIIHKIPIHRKNLRSVYIRGGYIYTASQDLTLKVTSINTYETLSSIKNCHNRMFYIVGSYQNLFVTTCPPLRETKIWDKETFELLHTLDFSSKNMLINSGNLYYDYKEGIDFIQLDELKEILK